jgi:hypothetical protein
MKYLTVFYSLILMCLCKCIPLCNNFTHKMEMQPQIHTKYDKLNLMFNPHLLNLLCR